MAFGQSGASILCGRVRPRAGVNILNSTWDSVTWVFCIDLAISDM